MLRPIPEDESDHWANESSVASMSAVAEVASQDEDARSEISGVSAVLGGADIGSSVNTAGVDVLQTADQQHLLAQQQQKKQQQKQLNRRQKRRRRRRKRHYGARWTSWRSFAVMGTVVVAAVAIVVTIVTTTSGGESSSSSSVANETAAPTVAPPPTPAPTIDAETVASMDAMVDLVEVPLNDSYSPYATETLLNARDLAQNWMLTQDLLRDEVLADPTTVRFKQRYGLALLFYSMRFDNGNGTQELQDTVMFSEASECEWTGIHCDEVIVETTETTSITLAVVRRIEWGERNAVGVLTPELRSLTYLQELNVSHNSLQDNIPAAWFEIPAATNTSSGGETTEVETQYYLPYLYLVDATVNELRGSVPKKFWNLPSLRFVYLSNNTFSSSLPSDAFFDETRSAPSPYLEDIWIDHNQFNGSVPAWLFANMTILKSFIADYNTLSGDLPVIETVPETLVVLDLSHNNLKGEIPPAFFNGTSLSYLYLDHNQFTTFTTPSADTNSTTTMGRDIPLTDVWLHDNALDGVLPDDFAASWNFLGDLQIQNNDLLTGVIPAICNDTPDPWPNLTTMQADCELVGGQRQVECDCCTLCFS